MDAFKPTQEELTACMSDRQCIRNICILAHVDHGKTTIADLLLATNLIVSKRLAGTIRYLDDRPDEQSRGITMKSSSVSLLNLVYDEELNQNRKLLFNLIDTPGHIDFSSEVGAAIRLCDGALIVVDAAEGVCAQTREAIKQAYEEHIKMILVINKLDRLIMELFQDVDTIFQNVTKIIEDCNVVVAEAYQYGFTNDEVDIEDTGLLFSPDTGNVIFASACDGWAFTTKDFCRKIIHRVQNETVDSLNKKMWNFDYWVDSQGVVKSGAVAKHKQNIFTSFCLKSIVHVYQTIGINKDRTEVPKILRTLGITDPTREMLCTTSARLQVKLLLSAWNPLSRKVFLQTLNVIPSPKDISDARIQYLLNANKHVEDAYLNNCVENFMPYLKRFELDFPTFCYVSKMFSIEKLCLQKDASNVGSMVRRPRPIVSSAHLSYTEEQPKTTEASASSATDEDKIHSINDELVIIGLARVFVGSLRVGQQIYALTKDYLPDETKLAEDPDGFVMTNRNVTRVTVKKLYILIGKDLTETDCVPAGNICGINGIDTGVMRTATLSTNLDVVPLIEHPVLPPVVRYAIEPVDPKELPILRHGLKLLNQTDSAVQVMQQETGELILLTAGDVHLEKCIEDLKRKYAKIQFNVSPPMVALRETVVNELSQSGRVKQLRTQQIVLSVKVVSLPSSIAEIITKNHDLFTTMEAYEQYGLFDLMKRFALRNTPSRTPQQRQEPLKPKVFKSQRTNKAVEALKAQLKTACEEVGDGWSPMFNKIWSVGKVPDCPNILINNTQNYLQNIFMELNMTNRNSLLDQQIRNAFQTFLKAGPICNEAVTNCAVIVNNMKVIGKLHLEEFSPQLLSVEETAVYNTFRDAFLSAEVRLMEPIFTTSIRVVPVVLGKVYSVISRRQGNVLEAVGMDEQEKSFMVRAEVPVLFSNGFATEIRKTTSGHADLALEFGGYKVINGHPYVVPTQGEDEASDAFAVRLDASMRAIKLKKDVRRRKGLSVDDEVVVHAEKQRTLNKKK